VGVSHKQSLPAFLCWTRRKSETRCGGNHPDHRKHKPIKGGFELTDDIEMIHGSGNVFRDLGLPNPEAEQLKSSQCWTTKTSACPAATK
jgi:hypothetical protein